MFFSRNIIPEPEHLPPRVDANFEVIETISLPEIERSTEYFCNNDNLVMYCKQE